MKPEKGIVNSYNGFTGKILSNNKEYLLTDKNTKDELKTNDQVLFIPESEKGINIARFVRKITK